ncbi:NERD domain-containing protein [Planococcus sp. YIM B11945]|uniref:NERD domain-containing protein n=1 Tax=Planococcus sp. YIM B11945 TaxID=3435410 RepID=UPI003D7C4E00
MILKERSRPQEIFQLESLIQRTPSVHPLFPQWTEKLRRITAGFHGEQRVDSLWHEIPLNLPHFFIHDLFIQKPASSHQIDSLLVTSRFVFVLEIKSITGLLNFDPQLRQFSRTNKDGSIDGMRNPDDQLRRHERWLEDFLLQQRLKLPVIGAIVFTYPSSVVQSRPGTRLMVQSSGLPHLMEQLLVKHPEEILTKTKTKQLAQKLNSLHSIKPLEMPRLPAGFVKGVLCPKCPGQNMEFHRRKWSCAECSYVDSFAHLDTLEQYRSLVSPHITNRDFREFIGIESVSTASKLMKVANMPFQGSFKDRVYLIPEKIVRPESISSNSESI